MTAVDARGRDRVQGPKESEYQRYCRLLTWLLLVAGVVLTFSWVGWTTTSPFDDNGRLTALMWLAGTTIIGAALLCARLVIGALRAAAEAAGE